MQVQQTRFDTPERLLLALQALSSHPVGADLLLVFADVAYFTTPGLVDALQAAYPGAQLLGCSTAGEIAGAGVQDGSCVLTALTLAQGRICSAHTVLGNMEDSQAAGERLVQQLPGEDLRGILVFGPGVQVNGSALVRGIESQYGNRLPVVGGLAGDGGAFAKTYTLGAGGVSDSAVVAVGFYGSAIQFAHGSFGGWEAFGPARKVTRCAGNILMELDGEPALEVYKRYLGEYADGLPASGLLFPLAMVGSDHSAQGLIRTILAVDESNGSLTLAGEIVADGYLRLMHASTDRLVMGAESAAEQVVEMLGQTQGQSLAVLVSCVGRKLVMGDRVDEEVEAVGDLLGRAATLTGFYSYGEISPFVPEAACRLHNQTMTITCIAEA